MRIVSSTRAFRAATGCPVLVILHGQVQVLDGPAASPRQ